MTKKILFFAEYITLSHPGRCFVLAELLRGSGYELALAVSPKVSKLIPPVFSQVFDLSSIPGEVFLKRVSKGSVPYTDEELDAYVIQEKEIIGTYKPDLIIGDFRLSLGVSARLCQIPYINIASVYWKSESQKNYVVPDLYPLTSLFPISVAQKLFDIFAPLAFKKYCKLFNDLRARNGLRMLKEDIAHIYTEGDTVIYDDIYGFKEDHNSKGELEAMHMGPFNWALKGELPDWWEGLPKDSTKILISVGSSGSPESFNRLIQALEHRKETLIIITAKNNLRGSPSPNIIFADYLPMKEALKSCDLFIGNGGISSYLALEAGVPAIGIPHILDQYLCCDHLAATRACETIRGDRVKAKELNCMIDKMLNTPSYRKAALAMADRISRSSLGENFINVIERTLSKYSDIR